MNIVHHPGLEQSSLKPCERKVVFYHSKCQQPIFISLKTMLIVNYCVGHFSRNNIRHSSKNRPKHCAQSLGKRTENPEKLRNLKAFKSVILSQIRLTKTRKTSKTLRSVAGETYGKPGKATELESIQICHFVTNQINEDSKKRPKQCAQPKYGHRFFGF